MLTEHLKVCMIHTFCSYYTSTRKALQQEEIIDRETVHHQWQAFSE